jgi:glycosyltransferase involved in cell wall biosynthesis
MRIVIVAYAACPLSGSEPGLGWNWAWYLSRHHEVWLVTFPVFRDKIEAYLAAHPNERLHVVWAELDPRFDPWRPGSSMWRAKLHYFLWLARMQRVVRELTCSERVEVVHFVSLNTVSAPPALWRLPIPFIWGPIGGGEVPPPAFRHYYGRDWWRECIRALRIRLVVRSPALRRAVRGARYLLANNRETRALLVQAGAGAGKLRLMADNGLRPEAIDGKLRSRSGDGVLVLLWAGRLEQRKALPVLIDALAVLEGREAARKGAPVRLLVAGGGPRREAWEAYAHRRNVAHRISFLGLVPFERMPDVFAQADLFVFTSLRDALGSVVLEAFGQGLPVLTLDHQGAINYPDDATVKVPVTTPEETAEALASAIEGLRRRPEEIERLSRGALAAAQTFDWQKRAAEMTRIYEDITCRSTEAA